MVSNLDFRLLNSEKCRFCLKSRNSMKSIALIDQKLLNHITLFSSIKISTDDQLPQNICDICVRKLEFSYDFFQQVKNSDTFLRNLNQTNLHDGHQDTLLSKEEKSTCQTCNKNFKTKNLLRRHLKIHTNLENYICDKCGRIYKELGSLNKHFLAEHSGREKPFRCSECLLSFNLRSTLIRHLRTHSGEKPFGCAICHKFYPSKSYLNRHKKIHSTTRERPFICEMCGKNFLVKDSLKAHLVTHFAKKPYQCNHCDRAFSTKGSLHSHTGYIHTKEKNFMCQVCAKKLMTKSELNEHMRRHTGEKKQRNHQCQTCFKKLSSSTHLKVHIKAEHTGEKPYECDFCSKAFVTKQALKIHRRYHTGDKPFKCAFCEKCFVTNGGRKVHERVHTGERPYVCATCGDTFSQSSSLKTHMKSH